MFGSKRLLAFVLLTALVSISISNTQQQGSGFFSRLFTQGKGLLSSGISSLSRHKASSRSYVVLGNGTRVAAASNSKAQARGHGGGGWGWGWDDGGGHGHGYGGGHGGGHGGGWQYSHTTHGHNKGMDMNSIIGGLAAIGLAGLGLYAFSRPATSTIVMMNMTGRRRRSADNDFDDEMMEGESLADFLARVGKYLESPLGGENNTQKVEPFKLY